MNADKDDRFHWVRVDHDRHCHVARVPLNNFRELGPLTPEQESWWREFGRKLEEAQRNFDKWGQV